MKPSRPRLPANLVPHPRFGAAPRVSGVGVREKYIREDGCRSRYPGDVLFPESVLVADCSRQRFATYPRRYYVDVLRECRTCRRPFLFFAEEQRHWFEELRFNVNAECVQCPECRKKEHRLVVRLKHFSDAMAAARLPRKGLMTLIDDAIDLLEIGILRDLGRLGALKDRARKEIGEYPGVERLAALLKIEHERRTAKGPPGLAAGD